MSKPSYEDYCFQEWLNEKFYEGFDPSGLSDEEYYELEDEYMKEVSK